MTRTWYARKTNHDRSFIADERSGKTVAIAYDHDDAELLAAAPELLEALQECVTDPNAQCIVTCDVAFMIRRFKAINEIVRAAIAKAEGG